MKLGILQCGNFAPELTKEFSSYSEMIETQLSTTGVDLGYVVYSCYENQFPDSPDECDTWLISGSKNGVYEPFDWITRLEDFVRVLYKARKKTIGICFGHQIMAQAMGGRVEKSELGWGVGVAFNQIAQRKPWMEPWCETMDIACFHQDQVVERPDKAEVLVGNSFCPYYMLQYEDCFLSIQGHPEFSREFIRALIDSKDFQIPPNRIREAMISLQAPMDSAHVIHWMIRFLFDAAP